MEEIKIPQEWNKFYLKDVSFVNLMTRRIFNVLIVANPYDAFMLEDDGRIDEKIFDEYMELGMRYPPTFTQVSTTEEANEVLRTTDIDLVICMPGNADNDAFTVAREVKAAHPDIPCVVLTPFSHGITKRIENEDMSVFDYVFCWLGNTNLIMSIIKLLEDKILMLLLNESVDVPRWCSLPTMRRRWRSMISITTIPLVSFPIPVSR